MQRGITKRTQINLSWTDIITASLMLVLQNMKTRNDGAECIENQQYSAPPTHYADSLAHRQSEYPVAQTSAIERKSCDTLMSLLGQSHGSYKPQ